MLRSDDVTPRAYKQVDVFTRTPLQGNPVAVVLEAEGLSTAQMQALARWTNLSETTFVLKPTHPAADYKVRIFTTEKELPFAGHPTLGTAHALLEAGLAPKHPGTVMQECGVGLVAVNIQPEGTLAFAAPEVEFRPMAAEETERLMAALQPAVIEADTPPVIAEMGIRWLMVRLPDAQSCLAVTPDQATIKRLQTACDVDGVVIYGTCSAAEPADYEMRAFMVECGALIEDPVTGSANACLARLLKANRFPDGGQTAQGYQVRQGTQLNRDGRVSVRFIDGEPWIGGQCRTLINGTLGI
ncbi:MULTISPECIES: PhzF family phenazine biosynthesis protein [Serratia]|uniref:Phenazine biosynthesis protein PhzF family n=1 Tax=Serratia marcescens TaxID=615 RepID=A0A2F0P7F3_SERMA|nr:MULTISPECIES: PhzF family phenazine biosynthesis protein [Serratia]AUY14915.1 PhzF family phenazine biosynthesis protein [Serratia sp. SSNIH1]OCO77432.1 phenazine biosynthesis protein PhzF family [Serratia marcescens]OCO80008.1 phenazine biosynthesis protein PhzF family [Serratia marcescens]POU50311.1 PhzF family phenazine biosynthesis protein [Serratia sp. SSNIH4]POW33851.1 PhzF family phenazine biosynthesis protein [Serratia sp. SSNIH5]